jgi:exosortase
MNSPQAAGSMTDTAAVPRVAVEERVAPGTWAATALAAVLFLGLYAPTVVWLWGRWTMSVWHNAHGLLIPFVVAYFAYQELDARRHLPARSSAWGFALLVPAMLLQALDAGMHTELLSAVSLVVAIPGLSLLFLGGERTRAIAFPLAFLAFALPIPLALTEHIHLVLRHIVADGTAALVPLLGVPVFQEGTTLHLAPGPVQVADACSGFSTLYAAVAVAFLTAYSTPSTARRALVLLVAAPLAILSNVLRVTFLVLMVVWSGAEVLESWIHPASGMATFALALPIIFWLGGGQGQRAVRPRGEPAAGGRS